MTKKDFVLSGVIAGLICIGILLLLAYLDVGKIKKNIVYILILVPFVITGVSTLFYYLSKHIF